MRELVVGDVVGGYVCEQELRRGGMAQLFVARPERRPQRRVVIKRILPSLGCDEALIHMFEKEARIGRTLRHPNIARVLGSGLFEGGPYIVVEHVHGVDLRQLLKRAVKEQGSLPLGVAVGIATEVARGLDYAHTEAGIVHRDVDPSNVLVGFDGAVKLVDFGIARTMAVTHTTRASWIKGKAGYMSPEQCLGMHLDRRTDIFALGILLYEMTTGYRLFHGATDYETTRRILAGDYVPPGEAVQGYPEGLASIVERALQTDPDQRWPTAEALTVALLEFSAAEGIALRAEDRVEVVRPFAPASPRREPARNRALLIGAALGVPVLLAGLAMIDRARVQPRTIVSTLAPRVSVELDPPAPPPPQSAPEPPPAPERVVVAPTPPEPAEPVRPRRRPPRVEPAPEPAPPAPAPRPATTPVDPFAPTLLPPSRREKTLGPPGAESTLKGEDP